MPAALTVETVDQSLVDSYLERANRFAENVRQFEKTLKEMINKVKDHISPAISDTEAPVYQETADAESVVTAEDIDLNQLLRGIDLNGMEL